MLGGGASGLVPGGGMDFRWDVDSYLLSQAGGRVYGYRQRLVGEYTQAWKLW